ncbi:MAG: hypothetical protein C0502_01870 [Opitutus sp.]|nr:hypothetical protein [Opitutus sp.]
MSSPEPSAALRSALLAALFLFGSPPALLHAQPAPGDPFPRLADHALEGSLPELDGRLVLVDFWASWCAPCKAAFPALARIHADYSARGVTLVGVSVDEKASAYAAFVKRHRPPFATVRDAAHKLAGAAKIPSLPTTVLVGRDGHVLAVFAGYHGAKSDAEIRTALDRALRSAP